MFRKIFFILLLQCFGASSQSIWKMGNMEMRELRIPDQVGVNMFTSAASNNVFGQRWECRAPNREDAKSPMNSSIDGTDSVSDANMRNIYRLMAFYIELGAPIGNLNENDEVYPYLGLGMGACIPLYQNPKVVYDVSLQLSISLGIVYWMFEPGIKHRFFRRGYIFTGIDIGEILNRGQGVGAIISTSYTDTGPVQFAVVAVGVELPWEFFELRGQFVLQKATVTITGPYSDLPRPYVEQLYGFLGLRVGFRL